MNRQPDGGAIWVGPDDPMPAMGRDQQAVARPQFTGLLSALDQQTRPPLRHHHPLVPSLVIPFPISSSLPTGDNPLDPYPAPGRKSLEDLVNCGVGKIGQNIHRSRHHDWLPDQ